MKIYYNYLLVKLYLLRNYIQIFDTLSIVDTCITSREIIWYTPQLCHLEMI